MIPLHEVLWYVPIAAIAVAFIVYGVGPLVVLVVFRHDADPDVRPVSHEVSFPEPVELHFSAAALALQDLRFESRGLFYLPQQTDNVQAIVQLFVHSRHRTCAMAVAMFTIVDQTWSLGTQYVEFCTRFQDGSEINSSNTREMGAFPSGPQKMNNALFCLPTPAELYAAHRALVDAYSGPESRELRVDERFDGDAVQYIADGIVEELESGRAAGDLKLTRRKTHYRATLFGAWRMTWQQLPPFNWIVRRARRREALDRLAAVGWERDAFRRGVVAEQIP